MTFPPQKTFRIISPKDLFLSREQKENFFLIQDYLKGIQSFLEPQIRLEQYSLPDDLIAFILTLVSKDLSNKRIIDFGCGTGRFTLPIAKFFAQRVIGVDIDYESVKYINYWKKRQNLSVDLIITPIEFLEPEKWKNLFDMTVMNPPFGTKRRRLDTVFLKKALSGSETVISIHKSNLLTRKLLSSIGDEYGKVNEILVTISFSIPPIFRSHRKKAHFVTIDLYKFASKSPKR
ncbi:MAG: methyltransferase domain-containing protein [Candidatus Heimdallarchaeota archaeon]|nr:methyltransferase domain-containing protein [Candidatus Heimdallarchaeota archaeon]